MENKNNLKIIFSIISLFLMISPLVKNDTSYYRTLFIFLINRIIDMCFEKNSDETTFFVVWSLINQWIGILACAVAFCSIAEDFLEICKPYSDQINIMLFVSAISCVLNEMIKLIAISVKENLIKRKLKKDLIKRKG